MNDKRLDQDINFEVYGVPCVMRLDTTVPEWFDGDLWIIKPRDPSYILSSSEGSPHEFGKHFASRISDAMEKLEGFDADGVHKRTPRQDYEWRGYDSHALLQVAAEPGKWTLAVGIMTSLPDWDGGSFGFYGSERLARLLADWKDGIPDIQFTRSNGEVIKFEEFIEHGGNPLVTMLDAFDDVMGV